ncbi:F-box/kelch-repeat protein-like protein [Tanacetum coccineum]
MTKTDQQQNHSIFNLPQDIIFDILSRLPTKSLIQFRCVNSSSPPLISHPSFTKLHFTTTTSPDKNHLIIYYETLDYINHIYSLRSPTNTLQETLKLDPPYKPLHGYLRIVGSNKGLLCFFDTNFYSNVGRVLLWNPSISRFKKVGQDPCHDLDKVSHFVVGFGFVLRNLEFKVVKIVYGLDNVNRVFVYELSSDSWRKIDGVVAPCGMLRGWSSNVVVNGFVNWLGFKEVAGDASHVPNVIMGFDLENECFCVLELPKDIVRSYDQVCLVSYGDESLLLALGAHYVELNGEKWDMWVMGEYGVVDSWKKVCVVSHPVLSIPPLLMRNDLEVLMVMNDGRLVLFDVIKNEMLDLETHGLPRAFNAIGYTASLALLQG